MKELKKIMSAATTVDEWNELREEAKKKFTNKEISELDASGFIIKILNKE
jgi:hypothetical protein